MNTAKLHTKRDAAKAFDLASEMEDHLALLVRAADALWLLSGSATEDTRVSNALYILAGTVEGAAEKAEELRGKIFHATWGFRHGEEAHTDQPHAPLSAGQIARLEAIIKEEKAAARKQCGPKRKKA